MGVLVFIRNSLFIISKNRLGAIDTQFIRDFSVTRLVEVVTFGEEEGVLAVALFQWKTQTSQYSGSPIHPVSPSKLSGNGLCAGDYWFHQHFDLRQPVNLLDDALNEYVKALELNPDDPKLLSRVGRVYLRMGKYEKAEHYAKRALSFDSGRSEAYGVLGFLAYKSKQFDQAWELLQKGAACGGLHTSRIRFLLHYVCRDAMARETSGFKKLGLALTAIYELAIGIILSPFEAEKVPVGKLVKMVPTLWKVHRLERRNDLETARGLVYQLVEKYPGCSSLMNMLGNLYLKLGRHEDANFWFYRAAHRDPLYEEALYGITQVLEEQGKFVEAGEIYHKILKLNPSDPDVFCHLGNTEYMLNDFEKAIEYYSLALSKGHDPKWRADLALSIGNIYNEYLNKPEAAMMAFQLAKTLNPKDVTSYIQLGVLYFDAGNTMNARDIYGEALNIEPNNAQIHCNLAYLQWMEGEIPAAVSSYEKTIALDPFYDIPHNNLGVIYMDNYGQMDRAVELLEKATRLNSNYALASYNLGRAYSLMGNKMEAANCFTRAQKLNQYTRELDNDELEERLNNLFS